MTYTLIPNIWYTITPETDCDLATPNGISIHLPAGIQYFHFADCVSIDITGTATVTQNPPLFKPASASALGGGFIESNLNVGHGAADAVAAVCTLTLGDLASGGTLVDSNGQSVELEAPHKYAEGGAVFRDVTEACTLTIGEWSKAWEAQPGSYALGYFIPVPAETQLGGTLKLMRGEEVIYSHEFAADEEGEPWTVASVKAELEADADWPCTILDEEAEIDFQAPVIGESWNDVELVLEGDLFEAGGGGTVYHGGMEGGEDARTAVDVFNDIHEDPDCPVAVTLDADEQGLGFTAKEYGVNDTIGAEGDMFSNWNGMSGGHGDYSVAELVTAIGGGFDDITPAAGETEGTITLTAAVAGADANAITYTATGCFGGGTVKQGSTTRGRNAVEQTAFKIYLNGAELDVEPAPLPTALTPTTAMRNGGVYTVDAAYEATTLSLPANATAEIWVRIGATTFNVRLPDSWVWVNGAASDMTGKTNTTFCISVRNDGVKVLASMQYSYDTTPAQS